MKRTDEPQVSGRWKALQAAREAPRWGARTRGGAPCRGAAMPNGRSRMHGGTSTGPRSPGGLERSRRANWKHVRRSAEAIAERKEVAAIWREISLLIRLLNAEEQTTREPREQGRS
jgi:hypothetical protein